MFGAFVKFAVVTSSAQSTQPPILNAFDILFTIEYEPICIHCSGEEDLELPEKSFPICASCVASSKQPVSK